MWGGHQTSILLTFGRDHSVMELDLQVLFRRTGMLLCLKTKDLLDARLLYSPNLTDEASVNFTLR